MNGEEASHGPAGEDVPNEDFGEFDRSGYDDVPRPVDWSLVTSGDAERLWVRLDTWARWLVARYSLDARELPRCWYLHGALVEELTALLGAHTAAFDPAQTPNGPADWHRLFWDTRARLHDWTSRSGCSGREHRPGDVPDWTKPDRAYAADFAARVSTDHSARKDAELRATHEVV